MVAGFRSDSSVSKSGIHLSLIVAILPAQPMLRAKGKSRIIDIKNLLISFSLCLLADQKEQPNVYGYIRRSPNGAAVGEL